LARPPKITREQIVRRFEAYCSNEKARAQVVAFSMDIYDRFKGDGLADKGFDSQLVGRSDEQFQQRLSELLLAQWLWEDGFTLSSSGVGPDFKATKGNHSVWIELVTPAPTTDTLRAHARPLQAGESDIRTVPSEEIKLRWLSALSDKKKQMDRHIEAGIIGEDEPYIVAVNKRMLDRFNWDVKGISQHPLPVEIGFGFGPRVIQIDRSTGKVLNSSYQHVEAVTKPETEVSVGASLFLLPQYQRVSGFLGIALHDRKVAGEPFPSAFAHNPFAKVLVPDNLIGAQEQWTGSLVNNVWILRRLNDEGFAESGSTPPC
jgi:hypothetical protein